MKKADVEKKMTEIKEAVEKRYPSVTVEVKLNEWEKGGYHRLYINLVVTGQVNGKTARESADFGFINLKTNRYNTNGAYDMRHFDGVLAGAEFISFYARAYEAGDNGQRYTVRPNCTDVLNVKSGQILSRREMLDKSWAMNIAPEEIDTYWDTVDAVNCAQAAQATESKDETRPETENEIGRYDGHAVTISPSADKHVVKDDGKYTGDYGRDRDDGIYWAAMYLYDKMSEGHVIKVENDEAYDYIIDAAEGMNVKIVTNNDGSIKKED